MDSKYPEFREKHCETAEELWKLLCPTNRLFDEPCKLIYRGQADSSWELLPSVLRKEQQEQIELIFGGNTTAVEQMVMEALMLEFFCEYCDEAGERIPGDSMEFRDKFVSCRNMERFEFAKERWPGRELDVVIAMAQHHGVFTRFLDWTKIPYIAAYFAAAEALAKYGRNSDKQMAVWVLNRENIGLYQEFMRIAEVPGGTSPHVSAQSGLFTVPLHDGTRGTPRQEPKPLESIFGSLPNTPLMKLTMPVEQSAKLVRLCGKAGYSGAKIFPTLDGAGKAVMLEIFAGISQAKS